MEGERVHRQWNKSWLNPQGSPSAGKDMEITFLNYESTHRVEAGRRSVYKWGSVRDFCVPIVCLRAELAVTSATVCKLLLDSACACKSQLSPTRYCHSCIPTLLHWKRIKKGRVVGGGAAGTGSARRREDMKKRTKLESDRKWQR